MLMRKTSRMKYSYKSLIDIYTDHVEFLQDQYKLILDNISDEEKTQPDISRKLKRLEFKILELNELIKTEEQKLESSQ